MFNCIQIFEIHQLTPSLSQGETSEDLSLYLGIINALQYLTMPREDILIAINKQDQFLHVPTIDKWEACNIAQLTMAYISTN